MLYDLYEFNHVTALPLHGASNWCKWMFRSPINPFSETQPAKTIAALCDLFERSTRRYKKPEFGQQYALIDGRRVEIQEEVIWRRPFAQLRRFKRIVASKSGVSDPKVLIVAPMSGHFATLLRGTVKAMLPAHDVYITDWQDARLVPLSEGRFDFNDYIDYVMQMLRVLGPNTHVMAVCQPGPAVLAATSLLAEDERPFTPASIILMGSPIDTRRSPTVPNRLAEERPLGWFQRNMIHTVPLNYPGARRAVYPGFLQLGSFIAMNASQHIKAHSDYFENLVKGDQESAEKHKDFYNEYLSVMDLTSEFYLQTIDFVFQRHLLAKGELYHRDRLVNPAAITKTALMTVEGEKDDISGIGQTQAAHELVVNIPRSMRLDYVQPGVGHYGVFNGRRYREEIQPRIENFIRAISL